MKAGVMRHAVYVLLYTDSYTAQGDRTRVFEPKPTPYDPIAAAAGQAQLPTYRPADDWAAIEPLKGRELVVARGMRADLSHRITMRYRPDVSEQSQIYWVQQDAIGAQPLIDYTFELGPEVNDELRAVEMSFYAYTIR